MNSSIEFIDNYNRWMIEYLKPYLGERLLEVGTGQGNFRKYFPGIDRYISIDIDAEVTITIPSNTIEATNITVTRSRWIDDERSIARPGNSDPPE